MRSDGQLCCDGKVRWREEEENEGEMEVGGAVGKGGSGRRIGRVHEEGIAGGW